MSESSVTSTSANAPAPAAAAAAVRRPELLAPAGDWECARAAVENGADAIYFGLEKFNARMRARNFTEADLPALMAFLHRRGVKGYVTFNTLVFQNELPDAERYLRALIAAGVDAAIVQDVGICRLIRRLSPDFPIHASTQMTVTSAGGIQFARDLGCQLVVLARENSLKEIGQLTKIEGPLPLEVFVHGALCVAYSGQCLTSEALGGRSANRGECAQACRMPYELIADGKPVPLGDRRYLLSPQDLAGIEVLPELVRLGVASLKIEGRLKTPEYVANVTRVYRKALDEIANGDGMAKAGGPWHSSPLTPALSPLRGEGDATVAQVGSDAHRRVSALRSGDLKAPNAATGEASADDAARAPSPLNGERAGVRGEAVREAQPPHSAIESGESPIGDDALASSSRPSAFDPRHSRYDLEMAFSRGLHTGWFAGINNQALVHARFGKKRGVFLGEVRRVQGERVFVRLAGPLKPGDGVVFDAGHPDEPEEGGRVYEVRRQASGGNEDETVLAFGRGDIDFARIHAGDRLWKTSDPELDRRLRRSFEGDQPRFQRPMALEAHGSAGQPMVLFARDEAGHVARVESAVPLAKAEKQPLGTERLREQFGRLGGTPFRLGELSNHLEGDVILPASELNRMRREAVSRLEALRAEPKRWTINRGLGIADCGWAARPDTAGDPSINPPSAIRHPQLIVLVRNLAQLEAALRCEVETLYCDFEDPKKYRDAVALVRHPPSAIRNRPSEVWVAPPRIFKPGEEWILKQVRSYDADGYLVRNYDQLDFFAGCRGVGDFSLNVANALAADYFKNKFGLERVTASCDLNGVQLEALLQAAPPAWFEVIVHQHMPMFHMEHCVFCAFLSRGTDFTNCGRPCDRHEVKLHDRVGAEHVLKADLGCRNTVFNARAQTGAEHVGRLLTLGLRHFRIEFLNEPPAEVANTIARYRLLLRGELSGTQLWRELRLHSQLGVTRGTLEKA